MAIRIGRFFKDLFATDTAEGAAEAVKATFELAEALDKDEIKKLAPILEQGGSLLDVLNSPLAELAESTLPFVKVATGLLKFYIKVTGKEPTLAQQVALVSQAAYLESFKANFLALPKAQELLQKIGKKPASQLVKQQFRQLDEVELDHKEAQRALLYFQDSKLAAPFNLALITRLQDLRVQPEAANQFAERVARDTNRYMDQALEEMGESVRSLREWYRGKGREAFEKYLSIDEYLEQEIRSKPNETLFDEPQITFQHLYVPLQAKRLDDNGNPLADVELVGLEQWVLSLLSDPEKKQQVLFVQGEAGRGKSVFCRMFSDRLSRDASAIFVPIVVRLRHLRVLESNLTRTLENYLQAWDFVSSDPGWLTDKNTQFLFLLDGFDELLLEGRASGGLKEFLQQVEIFQRQSHHRFLVTGRPLALQGVDRLITQTNCLERVELQPMTDQQQQLWLDKWQQQVGESEANQFLQFLQACPEDVREKLAREPLLLYLLARLHREGQLNVQMFEGTAGIQAKIRIYDESVKWVLEKQRQAENLRLTGLEPEDLRRVLTEAALCVVQSGNETAKVTMLEVRLKETNNPVAALIQQARQETAISDDRALNNLLTTFYLKPASGDKGGSIEFAHKSFSEFLFAKRLKEAIEGWSAQIEVKRQRQDLFPDDKMHKQIYDLLGYGGLTVEIVEYLMGLLDRDQEVDWIRLFKRLEDFYIRWCEGEFIDADPPTLPQQKMLRMREMGGDRETQLGQRQVDVYAGLNVMILLLELHRYAQNKDDLKDEILFQPCAAPNSNRLLHVFYYTQYLNIRYSSIENVFGSFLKGASLVQANLSGLLFLYNLDLSDANLSGANLSNARLQGTNFNGANLSGANLSNAYLVYANFSGANLSGADLSNACFWDANFKGANLSGANLSEADLSDADLSDAWLGGKDLDERDRWIEKIRSDLREGEYWTEQEFRNAQVEVDVLIEEIEKHYESVVWDEYNNWERVKGLDTAVNVPEELKRQLGLIRKDEE